MTNDLSGNVLEVYDWSSAGYDWSEELLRRRKSPHLHFSSRIGHRSNDDACGDCGCEFVSHFVGRSRGRVFRGGCRGQPGKKNHQNKKVSKKHGIRKQFQLVFATWRIQNSEPKPLVVNIAIINKIAELNFRISGSASIFAFPRK